MNNLYYQPSGKLPTKALLLALVGSLCALPLGWLYAWLIWNIPLVYLNFLITLGFGGALAVLVMMAMDRGLCRNLTAASLCGLSLGLVGLYSHWAAWLDFALAQSLTSPGWVHFLLHPKAMWALMGQLNEVGVWSLKGSEPVAGTWLGIVWGIEALILLALPVFGARSQVRTPFSESSGQWFEKIELSRKYAWVGDREAFVSQLESTPTLLCEMLQQTPTDEMRFALVSLHQCPGDPQAYFSLENVEVVLKQGKEKSHRSSVIEDFRISAEIASKLA